MHQHDDEQSVRHLVELGYVDPNEVSAHNEAIRKQQQDKLRHATELIAAGRLAEAAASLEELAHDDPSWIAPRKLLAETHYHAGRYDAAQAQLDWLTFHGIEHPRLALIAGAIALSHREMATAIELLEYAAYVEPDLPGVHRLLGTALLRALRLSEAADAFHEAIRRNSGDARTFDGLAAVCLRQANFNEAAEWSLQALEQDMQLFDAHFHLGLALSHLNRPQDALKALETSAKVDPTRGGPYRWLAKIAAVQLNEPERAADYRERGREVILRRRNRRRSD